MCWQRYFICLLLTGCAGWQMPPEFSYREISTSTFKIAVWQKIESPTLPYKIYIEGDGYAFNHNGRISNNPTPHGTLVRELAAGDKHPNVIYMARPCQFVDDTQCRPIYWSTARFAPEAVQAQYEAVKAVAGKQPLTLVGFSGGAQIAGLLAVKYPDLYISKLVTVAGNLDVKAWSEYHHLPALALSDDLRNYRAQYAKFTQVHYIGKDDSNIVPALTENFVTDKQQIIYIKNASHNNGWEAAFTQIRHE